MSKMSELDTRNWKLYKNVQKKWVLMTPWNYIILSWKWFDIVPRNS